MNINPCKICGNKEIDFFSTSFYCYFYCGMCNSSSNYELAFTQQEAEMIWNELNPTNNINKRIKIR